MKNSLGGNFANSLENNCWIPTWFSDGHRKDVGLEKNLSKNIFSKHSEQTPINKNYCKHPINLTEWLVGSKTLSKSKEFDRIFFTLLAGIW